MKTKSTEATAEIFWTAFTALPKAERHAVLVRLIADDEFREDWLDLAVVGKRRAEPFRPFRTYLEDRAKKKA